MRRTSAIAIGTIALAVISGHAVAAMAAAKPDLRVSATATVRFGAAVGSALKTTATVRNTGNGRAAASTTALVLSVDRVRGKTDVVLGRTATRAVGAGASRRPVLTGVLPRTLVDGRTYHLLVCADDRKVVAESREGNNCRTWRTFTYRKPAPPAPTTGPSGGAVSVCGGAYLRKPFSNGTGLTPEPGVRLVATPTASGAIPFQALPVGAAWDYENEPAPPYVVVTLTNTGTAPATSISDYTAGTCDPTWGTFSHVHDQGSPPTYEGVVTLTPACGNTLAPGASCQVAVAMWGATKRGGALHGYLGISRQVPGTGQHDYFFYQPITVASTSQGYWTFESVDQSGWPVDDMRTHARAFWTIRATNVGDRNAVPSFDVEGDLSFGLASDGWEPRPEDGTKCPAVFWDPQTGVVTGAVAPGGSCLFRIQFCTSVSGPKAADVIGDASWPGTTPRPGRLPFAFDVRNKTLEEESQC